MDAILSKISTSQPELYAILAVLVYAIKKVVPLIKTSVDTQQAHLASSQRTEKNSQDNLEVSRRIECALSTLATKDDMINVLTTSEIRKPMDYNSKQDAINA